MIDSPLLNLPMRGVADVLHVRRLCARVTEAAAVPPSTRLRLLALITLLAREACAAPVGAVEVGVAAAPQRRAGRPPPLTVSVAVGPLTDELRGRLGNGRDPLGAAWVALEGRVVDADVAVIELELESRPVAAAVRAVVEAAAPTVPGGDGSWLPPEAGAVDEEVLAALLTADRDGLATAAELDERSRRVDLLTDELEETNAGVLALYGELEEKAITLANLNETLEQRVAERTAEAIRRADQLRALAFQLTDAEQQERRRIAQTLHDHLQQLLVAGKMRLAMIRRRIREDLGGSVDQIVDLVDQSIEASRNLTVDLSPAILHEAGLPEALEWLARRMEDKHGLQVRVEAVGAVPPLRDDLQVLVFHATRELLFNTVKHAGVREAQVRIECPNGGPLRVSVSDRGSGFDPVELERSRSDRTQGGFGLFSIRERLEWIGGALQVDARVGGGTRMDLVAPLTRSVHERDVDGAEPSEARAPAQRALLVHGQALAREGMRAVLERDAGATVVGEASDPDEALSLAQALRPDVIAVQLLLFSESALSQWLERLRAQCPGVQVLAVGPTSGDGAQPAELARLGVVGPIPIESGARPLGAAVRDLSAPSGSERDDAGPEL